MSKIAFYSSALALMAMLSSCASANIPANSPANAKTPDKSQTIMGNPKFAGDPIMKSAGGDPVMLSR